MKRPPCTASPPNFLRFATLCLCPCRCRRLRNHIAASPFPGVVLCASNVELFFAAFLESVTGHKVATTSFSKTRNTDFNQPFLQRVGQRSEQLPQSGEKGCIKNQSQRNHRPPEIFLSLIYSYGAKALRLEMKNPSIQLLHVEKVTPMENFMGLIGTGYSYGTGISEWGYLLSPPGSFFDGILLNIDYNYNGGHINMTQSGGFKDSNSYSNLGGFLVREAASIAEPPTALPFLIAWVLLRRMVSSGSKSRISSQPSSGSPRNRPFEKEEDSHQRGGLGGAATPATIPPSGSIACPPRNCASIWPGCEPKTPPSCPSTACPSAPMP